MTQLLRVELDERGNYAVFTEGSWSAYRTGSAEDVGDYVAQRLANLADQCRAIRTVVTSPEDAARAVEAIVGAADEMGVVPDAGDTLSESAPQTRRPGGNDVSAGQSPGGES